MQQQWEQSELDHRRQLQRDCATEHAKVEAARILKKEVGEREATKVKERREHLETQILENRKALKENRDDNKEFMDIRDRTKFKKKEEERQRTLQAKLEEEQRRRVEERTAGEWNWAFQLCVLNIIVIAAVILVVWWDRLKVKNLLTARCADYMANGTASPPPPKPGRFAWMSFGSIPVIGDVVGGFGTKMAHAGCVAMYGMTVALVVVGGIVTYGVVA